MLSQRSLLLSCLPLSVTPVLDCCWLLCFSTLVVFHTFCIFALLLFPLFTLLELVSAFLLENLASFLAVFTVSLWCCSGALALLSVELDDDVSYCTTTVLSCALFPQMFTIVFCGCALSYYSNINLHDARRIVLSGIVTFLCYGPLVRFPWLLFYLTICVWFH